MRAPELAPADINALIQEYCNGSLLHPAQVRAEWARRYGDELSLYSAAGCETCNGTGYYGHIGLFQLMRGGTAMRPLIRQQPSGRELTLAAMREGMRTLKQDGIEKALAGICDLAEVRAATA